MNEEQRNVISAAVAWARSPSSPSVIAALRAAVAALRTSQASRELTWGQVPAGWDVLAPDGSWYRIVSTSRVGPVQRVALDGLGAWSRDPKAPVAARPGAGGAMDEAIASLGFPEVLEDES